MRLGLLGLMLLSVFSCARTDEYLQITFEDEVYLTTFVKELDSNGVPYVVDGNVVKYSERYSAEIKRALQSTNQSYPALFTIIDKSVMLKFRQALIEKNVPYEEKRDDNGGYVFIVDKNHRGLADKLLDSVTNRSSVGSPVGSRGSE